MTSISKNGCATLARFYNREMIRDRKLGLHGLANHAMTMRDSYMASARAK
ncbi:hypothetical protein [Pseudomonas sp. D3-10]